MRENTRNLKREMRENAKRAKTRDAWKCEMRGNAKTPKPQKRENRDNRRTSTGPV
jgi:hypothetical protein